MEDYSGITCESRESDVLEIKQVTIDDIYALQQISRQTFSETFLEEDNEANMVKYLEQSFATDKLTGEITNTASHFYFALLNHTVIGYLKLNTGSAQTEAEDPKALEIERIYVRSAYHGKRVGQALYQTALHRAEELAAPYVWLGVWEENKKALRFYEKNGFVAFSKHIFRFGDEDQTDIMMKKVL